MIRSTTLLFVVTAMTVMFTTLVYSYVPVSVSMSAVKPSDKSNKKIVFLDHHRLSSYGGRSGRIMCPLRMEMGDSEAEMNDSEGIASASAIDDTVDPDMNDNADVSEVTDDAIVDHSALVNSWIARDRETLSSYQKSQETNNFIENSSVAQSVSVHDRINRSSKVQPKRSEEKALASEFGAMVYQKKSSGSQQDKAISVRDRIQRSVRTASQKGNEISIAAQFGAMVYQKNLSKSTESSSMSVRERIQRTGKVEPKRYKELSLASQVGAAVYQKKPTNSQQPTDASGTPKSTPIQDRIKESASKPKPQKPREQALASTFGAMVYQKKKDPEVLNDFIENKSATQRMKENASKPKPQKPREQALASTFGAMVYQKKREPTVLNDFIENSSTAQSVSVRERIQRSVKVEPKRFKEQSLASQVGATVYQKKPTNSQQPTDASGTPKSTPIQDRIKESASKPKPQKPREQALASTFGAMVYQKKKDPEVLNDFIENKSATQRVQQSSSKPKPQKPREQALASTFGAMVYQKKKDPEVLNDFIENKSATQRIQQSSSKPKPQKPREQALASTFGAMVYQKNPKDSLKQSDESTPPITAVSVRERLQRSVRSAPKRIKDQALAAEVGAVVYQENEKQAGVMIGGKLNPAHVREKMRNRSQPQGNNEESIDLNEDVELNEGIDHYSSEEKLNIDDEALDFHEIERRAREIDIDRRVREKLKLIDEVQATQLNVEEFERKVRELEDSDLDEKRLRMMSRFEKEKNDETEKYQKYMSHFQKNERLERIARFKALEQMTSKVEVDEVAVEKKAVRVRQQLMIARFKSDLKKRQLSK